MRCSSGRLEVRAENRAYDLHRPDGCTVLAITRSGWPGNEFGLWLPEVAASWNNWEGEQRFQKWQSPSPGKMEWSCGLAEADVFCGIEVDGDRDCLWYSIEITDTSEVTLRNTPTQTCFHLVNAPEFISIRGERYWACLDGAWRTTDTVPRHESLDPRRVTFLRRGARSERTILHRYELPNSILAETACHPLFIAESFDGRKSVGIACGNMYEIANNNDYILRCLHSEPPPIPEILPSETGRVEGVILFCAGDHEALLRQYQQVVPPVGGATPPADGRSR